MAMGMGKLSTFLSAWLWCLCSFLEPSCTASGVDGWRRNGSGGGDLPVFSFPSPWYASRYYLKAHQGNVPSIFLILLQAALLLNPSPVMVGMNIRVAACEGIWESILQLCLQLFVIFSRSDTIPSFLQVGWDTILKEISVIANPPKDCSHSDILVHGVFGCHWRFHPVRDEQGKGEKRRLQILQWTHFSRKGSKYWWSSP